MVSATLGLGQLSFKVRKCISSHALHSQRIFQGMQLMEVGSYTGEGEDPGPAVVSNFAFDTGTVEGTEVEHVTGTCALLQHCVLR